MKKIFCYIIVFILIICLSVIPAFATEGESGTVETEIITETEAESAGDAVADSSAESETGLWDTVKAEFVSDIQFWTVIIFGVVMALIIVFVLFVLIAKTNPTARKSMYGMNRAIEVVKDIKNENSQTLGKLQKEVYDLAVSNEERLYKIEELEQAMADAAAAAEKEKRNVLLALAYDMRIHKLICDRLAMPLNDKSVIDMWYAKGIDAIKDELGDDEVSRLNSITAILDEGIKNELKQ